MMNIQPNLSEKFDLKQEIGKGSYGTVHKAVCKKTKKTVAVKKIFGAFRNRTDAQRTYREIAYLNQFRNHPNIITLLGVERAEDDKDVYLVFEFMPMDLQRAIRNKTLNDSHRRCVMYQIFRALRYLHSINVIHRDLKPSNILLDEDCNVKVADFGLARFASSASSSGGIRSNATNNSGCDEEPGLMTEYVATRWYRAPEVLVSLPNYTAGIDNWSLGCILGEMLINRPLFPGTNTIHQLDCIMSALPAPSLPDIESLYSGYAATTIQRSANRPKRLIPQLLGSAPEEAVTLVKALLEFLPWRRPSTTDCLKHSYVRRYFVEEDLLEKPCMDLSPQDESTTTLNDYRNKVLKIIDDSERIFADNHDQKIDSKTLRKTTKEKVNAYASPSTSNNYRLYENVSDGKITSNLGNPMVVRSSSQSSQMTSDGMASALDHSDNGKKKSGNRRNQESYGNAKSDLSSYTQSYGTISVDGLSILKSKKF